MIQRIRTGRKTLFEWLAVLAACVLFAVVASASGWLWRIDGVLYDMGLQSHLRTPDPDIVIIAVDDRSLDEIGRWPWDRGVHAALVERLTAMGARVIAFNVALNQESRDNPEGDAALARAIARHGAVVLPVTYADHGAKGAGEGMPAQRFAAAAAALGHINMELDPDGIARSLYLWEGEGAPRHPHLALAVLGLERPERLTRDAAPEAQPVSGWVRADWMHVPFSGPPGTFQHVSYADVLSGRVAANRLRDAVVLVGPTAVSLGDLIPTPASGFASLMPRVELHANVLGALRRGEEIRVMPKWVNAPMSAVLVICLMLVMLRTRPRTTLMAAFAFAGMGLLGAWWALIHLHVWVPPSAAIVATMLAFPLWSWRRLEASRRYFELELAALRDPGDGGEQNVAKMPNVDSFFDNITVLREAVRRQRELQRSREETMHFLSHDLRAPLAAIITLIDSNRRPDEPLLLDEATAMRVDRQARNALALADNLLRLVKAEGADPLRFLALNLEMLVQDALDEVWSLAREKQINLGSELPTGPDSGEAMVMGDADLLRRAIVNLLTNAIKYTPAGGRVVLRLRRDGIGWAIDVQDTGVGIPPKRQAMLFQRFSRLATKENRSISGIGLGLLMVRTVLERHGGSVSVKSVKGKGSTFTLWLPLPDPAELVEPVSELWSAMPSEVLPEKR